MIEVLKRARAILPESLFLGGSHALQKFFGEDKIRYPNDIDLFFYGPRPMETWALRGALKSVGFEIVQEGGYKQDRKYLIPGQYKYFVLRLPGERRKIDLIMIDHRLNSFSINDVSDTLGSTLAGIMYGVDYSKECIQNSPAFPKFSDKLKIRKQCGVVKDRNTKRQYEKVIQRCISLDLEITNEI